MTAKQWARVRQAGVYGLRRGAWYAVVAESGKGMVILNVSKRNVPVPRDQVDLRDAVPDRWSVVQWDPSERGAQRASEIGFGPTYAVCPGCRARAQVEASRPRTMLCLECAGEYEVEWEPKC